MTANGAKQESQCFLETHKWRARQAKKALRPFNLHRDNVNSCVGNNVVTVLDPVGQNLKMCEHLRNACQGFAIRQLVSIEQGRLR